MYEDDPQDTVFDVLGEAVFGGHPLGPPDHRPRAGDPRHAGRRRSRRSTPRRYVPGVGRHRGRGLGRPRPDRRAGRAHARRRGAGDARRRIEPAPADPAPHRALPAQGHRAVPRLPRRDRPAARRRPPLRLARARRDLRRPVLVAAVPGRARGARARLLGLLVRRPVRRHRPDRPVRRHAAGQGRRGDGRRGATSSRACASSPPPRRSSSARARTSRRAWCSRWSRPARA